QDLHSFPTRRSSDLYNELQTKYHAELNKLATPHSLGKNRGNALSGAERGITLAQRRGRGINVANNAQAVQVSNLAKSISYTGKGLVALGPVNTNSDKICAYGNHKIAV